MSSERRTRRTPRLINNARSTNQNLVSRTRLTNNVFNNQIEQITTPQTTNTIFEDNIFNGVNFDTNCNSSFESLVLPAGFFVSFSLN
jgi:hypothetical protein